MATRRNIVYIPSLSEYIFWMLKNMNATQRANLTAAELSAVKDDYSTRNFVNKETLDYLLMMVTKAGKQWDLRIYDNEDDANQLEFNIVNQFQYPEKRMDVIDVMVKKNLYYMSSMDVMLSAHMGSQNAHSKVYELSASTKMAVKAAKGIAAIKLQVSHQSQVNEANEATDILNKLLLVQLNSVDWAKSVLDLEANDLRVLLTLFAKRHSAMTVKDMARETALEGKPVYFKKILDKLKGAGLIISDEKHGPKTYLRKGRVPKITPYYMINTPGIAKVMEYRNYIHKMTFGA